MAKIWAIGDLHLAFGVPSKNMEVFGPVWKDYPQKIESHWRALVQNEDLILIPGDISWALHLPDALVDLKWIDALPGTKVMIKGNHDYWWPSPSKLKEILPPSIHFIQNNAFDWGDVTVGGVRLWDSDEYQFNDYIEFKENPLAKEPALSPEERRRENRRLFERDVARLKTSLEALNPKAQRRLVMTHYPPIGADLESSQVSQLLENYQIDVCAFGHLHNVKTGALPFGSRNGVRYVLTSADYLDFKPIQIF